MSGLVREMLRDGPTPPPTPVIEDPRHDLVDLTENSGVDAGLQRDVSRPLGCGSEPFREPHSRLRAQQSQRGSHGERGRWLGAAVPVELLTLGREVLGGQDVGLEVQADVSKRDVL